MQQTDSLADGQVQCIFRAAIALRPSVPLFVAFQMAQGVTSRNADAVVLLQP